MKAKQKNLLSILIVLSTLMSLYKTDQEIKVSDNYMVKVKDNYNINNPFEVRKDGEGWNSVMLSQETRDWDLENGVCWLTNRKKWEAKPSLRSCYSTSTNACCNFM